MAPMSDSVPQVPLSEEDAAVGYQSARVVRHRALARKTSRTQSLTTM